MKRTFAPSLSRCVELSVSVLIARNREKTLEKHGVADLAHMVPVARKSKQPSAGLVVW